MANKFHINKLRGTVSRCRATQKCPFGGESGTDNHFDSIAEAREQYEKIMEKKSVKSLTNESESVAIAKSQLQIKEKELRKVRSQIKALEDKDERANETEEWMDLNYLRKKKYFETLMARKKFFNALSDEDFSKLPASMREGDLWHPERVKNYAEVVDKPAYVANYHPVITKNNKSYSTAVQTISTFSGKSFSEVENLIQKKIDNGESLTNACRVVWNEAGIRTDKKIVSLDLEAAAPLIHGKVDRGTYSNIIEVGYIVYDPKTGESFKKSYLCGADKNLLEAYGTGAENVHHISPDMIKNLKPFDEDDEKQKELLRDLSGSILMAHNAYYEKGQFQNSLKGFSKAVKDGDIEILDTVNVCKFFMPEAKSNTNESFVESSGGKYENAHRAFEDAHMSLNSLLRHKNIAEVE